MKVQQQVMHATTGGTTQLTTEPHSTHILDPWQYIMAHRAGVHRHHVCHKVEPFWMVFKDSFLRLPVGISKAAFLRKDYAGNEC